MRTVVNYTNRRAERSLALHQRIAEKVRADPALLDIARGNLRRWQQQGADVTAFDEWRQILDGPVEGVLHVLTDASDHAAWLRRSSPFPGILTDEERLTIFRRYAIPKDRLTAADIESPDWPLQP
jgi:hypothetical protein